jgi:two-component system cell cycle response regulator
VTLRGRLSLLFALVVLAPLLAGALLVGILVPRALTNQVTERLVAGRALISENVSALCTRGALAAEIVGRAAFGPGGSPAPAVRAAVDRGLASYASVAGAGGSVLAAAGNLPGVSGVVSLNRLDSCGSAPVRPLPGVIGATLQVRDAAGRVVGTAAAAFAARAALDPLLRGSGVSVTLISAGRPVASMLGPRMASAIAAAGSSAGARPIAVGPALVLTGPLPGALTAAVSAAAPSETELDLVLALLLFGGLLLAAGVGWQLGRVTVQPLVELAEVAGRVAGGDLDARIAVRPPEEIRRLAVAFNDMTEELRESIGEIRSSHGLLRHTLERFGETLSGTLDSDRITGAVLDAAMTITAAGSGAAYLRQGADQARLVARRGPESVDWPEVMPLPVPAEGGQPDRVVIEMRSGGGLRGLLWLADPQAGGFSLDATDAVSTFAAQAGVAVENVRLHEEAQRQSMTDALTGLANFRALQLTLAKEVERASRFHRPLALLMIDLDHFKLVNDRFGHQQGDAVLAEVARRLATCVREVDTVARYGGEEFAVVLPEAGAEGAARTAERICAVMRSTQTVAESGDPVAVTVSVGAAVFPDHGPNAAMLVRTADRALYAAKAAGRDRWRLEPVSRPVAEADR